VGSGGIVTGEKVENINDLVEILRNDRYSIV
jgi:hypothetical protein